jgi:hypothetical protein
MAALLLLRFNYLRVERCKIQAAIHFSKIEVQHYRTWLLINLAKYLPSSISGSLTHPIHHPLRDRCGIAGQKHGSRLGIGWRAVGGTARRLCNGDKLSDMYLQKTNT